MTTEYSSYEFHKLHAAERLRTVKLNHRQTECVLPDGEYRVVEHDNEVNIAIVTHCNMLGFVDVEWFTLDEFQKREEQMMADAYLTQQLLWEPEDE